MSTLGSKAGSLMPDPRRLVAVARVALPRLTILIVDLRRRNGIGALEPATEIDIIKVEHKVCSHALVNRADGSQVRVISANISWPIKEVRRTLAESR